MTDQPNGLQAIGDRYRVSLDAVRHLVHALEAGNGRMAQFNHPELGGFGQWSGAGMTMIGDMFNADLKARVDALCTTLAAALPAGAFVEAPRAGGSPWPAEWGAPATSGSQNGMRYAYFPAHRRLVVEADGRAAIYDTGDHTISGVSQQQGGSTNLRFSGPGGPVDLASLRRLDEAERGEARPFAPEPFEAGAPGAEPPPAPGAAPVPGSDVLTTIERLSEMRRKGILTEGEFTAKKAELLARL
ncbi:hypothetical protein ASF49_06945 [Methylobacterium sp. Leaf104]|uniref:SHOCT domain-containing protein n=1 Tax=Methylobacterium TaxID=407 RepID=UPI0006F1D164|nr:MULTISPECIES: SHOCT domain-containing protein [Methylobacterium]KQP33619.1 hypothetical protein ASF49_06945 [Methylobacterium sp. Leaf104]MCI9879845.1 SHOCT domain-containing protein [Methylobacterium goesingense]